VRSTFQSDSNPVSIDYFLPSREGAFPIVIALHGSGGLSHSGHLDFAQWLADRGFCLFVPHYFESTGTVWASEATIWREFPAWLRVVSDAIDFASQIPAADASRIGIVGFSLGAYLALSIASQEARISAVVDFFGGMPEHFAERLEHIAPVLILHGEADPVVPVEEAHKIARLLDARSLPYEKKLYPGAGHGFSGFDMLDAGQRTYSFLTKHLHG
jgi:carboxymethylenebutenolidase